jgi:hypothetical protein
MTATFAPHAIILTERRIPQPIFPVATAGPEKFLRIDFDPGSDRGSYVAQVLRKLPGKLSRAGDGTTPCFGKPIGFVINYTEKRAEVFGPDGEAREILNAPYRVGEADITVKGRSIPAGSVLDRARL